MKKYYEAYEDRYKQSYELGMLWETKEYTKELVSVIDRLNITKDNSILEVGCGEGRDAINLLNNGYNVIALDYSISAINKINELTNNKYKDNFISFDIMKGNLDKTFDFIYSIAVLHMFVNDEDRDKFWEFINSHLSNNGYACVMVMGDGLKEYSSDINDAYKLKNKININTNEEVLVASTSCRIVNFRNLEDEINRKNLKIVDKYISTDIPNFDKVMCVIVRR